MGQYYLAVDIGASSGRHVLGCVRDGKIILEEVYRFENGLVRKNGRLCWDSARLFREIVSGMKRCAELGKAPASVGIDTWGVDFALLDADGELIGDTVGYRDSRTQGMDAEVEKLIPAEELYRRTGIQKQSFNTIYQLMAVKLTQPDQLRRAGHFLMMPEYFNYLLTGKIKNEYTNATTTGLLHAEKKNWDFELIGKLGLPASIFGPVFLPTTEVGGLKPEIRAEVGYDCKVVLPATHDTGSAVMAVPAAAGERSAFLSSGTWSLMGVERPEPDCREESRKANFTNEGGFDYRFRFLKNIMGLWIIQSARHELPEKRSFDELCEAARQCGSFPSRIDVNDGSFLAPDNMTEAIRAYCRRTGQRVPESVGEIFAVVYHSLAESYAGTVRGLEEVTGGKLDAIRIVGGGTKDEYLNELTAQATGKKVLAGPVEATATGNLMAQMIRSREFDGLRGAREAVARSFPIREY